MTSSRRELLLSSVSLTAAPARRPPNVVMFMTDDHGAWANGCYGCPEIHTPNIDRLAREGMRFDRAYACTPVCSPSRMTYITGKLPSLHGVQDYLIPEDTAGPTARRWLDGHTTYTEILARNGYTLGLSGKWHMGEDERAQRGFSYWATVPGGGGTYRDPEFIRNGERIKVNRFKTDAVGDFAIDFIEQSKDKPFYLLVPFYAPHTPYDYQPAEYRKPYENAKFTCYPRGSAHPDQNPSLKNHHNREESMRSYSALITGADANIGRIVKRLEELGLRENTLVIFTADQGWNAGHHGVWGKGNGTVPFNMYEESLRVPLIWNHPGRIPAGSTTRALVSSYDYFPTILDYLNVPSPVQTMGRSCKSVLAQPKANWTRNRLFFEYAYVRGIRTENLKYIERAAPYGSELYDLEADPGETVNHIDDPAYRKQRDALARELAAYFAKQGAPPLAEWKSTTRQKLFEYRK
jgi:arylsulfatase A-like enzyme